MSTRKALHSGGWYSSSKSVLTSELDGWLSKAARSHFPARAIIAPHAGYSYCGACGAFAYKQVDSTNIKRVFVLGPSHHVYLSGCALSPASVCETPLYNIPIDLTTYAELQSTGQFEQMSLTMDEEEHSIEMHLPYIAKVMESRQGQFTVVPVLVGALKEGKEELYGRIFSRYLADPQNLFVVSSDFCHWGSRFHYTHYNKKDGPIHSHIEKLDHDGMEKIESLDPRAFSAYLQETRNTICGRHPIAVLLNAVSELQSSGSGLDCRLKFVCYAQSNKCRMPRPGSSSSASSSNSLTPSLV